MNKQVTNESQTNSNIIKKRVKKVGKVSAIIAKSTIWYPLKVVLMVLWKVFTYLLNILFTILLVGMITGVVVAFTFILYIQNYIDPTFDGLDDLQFDSNINTTLYYTDKYGDEVLMADDTLHIGENHMWAEYREIPQYLLDAVVAIEDKRFYSHNGVDVKRTLGAVLNFVMPGGASYGGSTLTQQLIKNVSQEDDVTIQRKVQEIFRAIDVEKKYDKSQIIEMYLNIISLSQNTQGVKTAAYTYFNKSLSELSLLECAALAAIPKYPTHYDPIRNPDNNLQRRNVILEAMLEQEKITQEEFDNAYNVPLYINTGTSEDTSSNVHNYYVDAVIDDVISTLMEMYNIDSATASRRLYSGGLQIVINMDPLVQAAMEEVYTNDEYFPKVTGVMPQSAMVVLDPLTGNVLGLVGGRGQKTTNRGLNRATISTRQCGSAIKPLSIYALAIDRGLINYGTSVEDYPDLYIEDEKRYWPKNTPAGYYGLVPLSFAIEKSLNTIPVRLVQQLGVNTSFEFLTQKLGFTTLVESKNFGGQIKTDIDVSPLALGSFTVGVSVLEMAQGYSMFANGGVVSKAKLVSMIRNSSGEIIYDNRIEKEPVQAISEQSAYIMSKLLQGVVKNTNGTARNVINKYRTFDKEIEVGGKTGSTNDDRDRYFMGYTPNFVGAVWFGYDSNKSLNKLTENPATAAWVHVMNKIYDKYTQENISYRKQFDKAPNVYEIQYCTLSGKRATEACVHDLECVLNTKLASKVQTGYFTSDSAPVDYCDVHVMVNWDKKTQAISVEGCDCPEQDIIQVALRRVQMRVFEASIIINDTQYTYVDVPEGYIYPNKRSRPFFYNLYESDKYIGLYNADGKPYNAICTDHYHN
ncbi:transglycosylase domain-containing protein [Eubacteriales bacterium OttesenSCG-928-G02]|nr:transglycosylase domain-containing protein [Eubacteriales bacterium OttesenSCG-928-G02]